MTVLQMSGADAGRTSPPPRKKRRFSQNRAEQCNQRYLAETWKKSVEAQTDEDLYQMPAAPGTMVNGYGTSDPFPHALVQASPEENGYSDTITPIVPLLNLGNTCFLNSVLYTLRFAPSFLHKLHHLSLAKQMCSVKMDRGCSISRNLGKSGSWSNKDTFSYSAECSEGKIQTVINKLHNLYATLCGNEYKDRMEPYQPSTFLQSLREVNPIFEGNQQHDAHELLVCLLDIIREACELTHQERNATISLPPEPSCPAPVKSSTVKTITRKLKNFPRKFLGNNSDGDIKKYLKNGNATADFEDDNFFAGEHYSVSQGTIFEDFRGVSLLQTKCLECEQITERKETFCDICVPIETTEDCDSDTAVDKLYQSIIVTEEYLIDNNKYWCEKCCRYNEARRCVKYEKLPRLLTLHLKRFSSNYGTCVAKVNDHMPTPFTLSCFCEECLNTNERRPHYYTLYGIIMHLGATIASGHYVSFVKTLDSSQDYLFCTRDKPKTSSLPRGTCPVKCELSSTSEMVDKQAHNSFCRGLFKLSSKSFNGTSANSASSNVSRELELRARITSSCRGSECCTIRLRGLQTLSQDMANPLWLQCDDETIRVLTTQELADILSPRSSESATVTPYLLFYARVDV